MFALAVRANLASIDLQLEHHGAKYLSTTSFELFCATASAASSSGVLLILPRLPAAGASQSATASPGNCTRGSRPYDFSSCFGCADFAGSAHRTGAP